jgi:hypothetical protein
MSSRWQLVDLLSGAACLVALAAMSVATCLPFMGLPDWGALVSGDRPPI